MANNQTCGDKGDPPATLWGVAMICAAGLALIEIALVLLARISESEPEPEPAPELMVQPESMLLNTGETESSHSSHSSHSVFISIASL